MGFKAGDETEGAEAVKTGKSKKSIYLILAGLVVGGAAAIWRWVRKMPK